MRKAAAFLAILLSGVLSAPAFAEEAGAGQGGLPQFDVSLFPEQLFWLAVSFAALYLLMRFVALPGVARVQENRGKIIAEAIEAAKKANRQANDMAHQSDRDLAAARAKAQATISAIKAEAAKQAAEQERAQAKQLNQRLREAEAAIAAKRDAALKEIESTASDLAAAIVDNVTGYRVKA